MHNIQFLTFMAEYCSKLNKPQKSAAVFLTFKLKMKFGQRRVLWVRNGLQFIKTAETIQLSDILEIF